MNTDDLYNRNLKIFEERFPAALARIKSVDAPLSKLRFEDGIPVDIDLGDGFLHQGGGREKEIGQADTYLKNPQRIQFSVPVASSSDSMISRRVFLSILSSIKEHGGEDLALQPVTRTGFLIVLGVGMGYHLPILAEKIDPPHLVIVEPVAEFLAHSLRVIDWEKLVSDCDDRNTTIQVFCEQSAEQMTSVVCSTLQKRGIPYLDGSYIYVHYPLWTLMEAKRRLINQLPLEIVSRGYFEDERKMIWNTVTNLYKVEFRILERKPRKPIDIPVFLIGAGASLDESAEIIREFRDRVIVFSSGSALQSCLKHDIIPDFHTELENGPIQYEKIKHMVEARPDLFPDRVFKGITLIGSTTLSPRVAPFFENVIFFFRDSISSTTSFGRGFSPLDGIAPTVANTSLATAGNLGFREAYMFGFDCGWRDNKSHHAKDTIYYTSDTFKQTFKGGTRDALTVRGNFGGEVRTELVLDWSRTMLEQFIAGFGIKVFNCSDGAFIEGAIPKVPEAVMLTNPPLDRPAALKEIVDGLPHYKPREFFEGMDFKPFRDDLEDYGREIKEVFDRIIAEKMDFFPAHDLIMDVISGHVAKRVISSALYFTTQAELRLAAGLTNRIADPDLRHKVVMDFFGTFRDMHDEMLAETRTILDEAEIMIQGGPEPWWTAGLAMTKDCSY